MVFCGSMHLREGLAPGSLLFAALLSVPLVAAETQPTSTESDGQAALAKLVEAYFQTPDPDDRRSLIGRIDAAAEGSIDAVVATLGAVQLWKAQEEQEGTFSFPATSGETIRVAYHLPSTYDPARKYPAVVWMPLRDASQKDCASLAREVLGDMAEAVVLICPTVSIDGSFHRGALRDKAFHRFLRAVRRKFHVDTDRTYLWGGGEDGEASWMAAVTRPHDFAGALLTGSYLNVPYPEQLYRLLLGNLRTLSVLAFWNAADDSSGSAPERSVVAHNRAMLAIAKQEGLPITGKEVAPELIDDSAGFARNQIRAILTQRRAVAPDHISLWFRYPDQGDIGWVRLTKFKGDVWEEEQLSILPSPLTDRDEYIRGIIEDKLGYIGATVQGQTINIETRKCGKIDILFPLGLVDLDRPVTIFCNGRRRHNGPIRSSIRTLLETAYDTWDFQRLTPARLSLSIKSDRGE